MLFTFLCWTTELFAQNYLPLDLNINSYWKTNGSYCCFFNSSGPACHANFLYKVVGDTTIASKFYHRIEKSFTTDGTSNCFTPGCSIGINLIREDTISKKIFGFVPWTNHDTLLMDFSQQIGDTCNMLVLPMQTFLLVTSIDSISLNGIYHRRINYGTNFSLIEGIGSTLGIIDMVYSFENNTTLYCKGNNGYTQFPDTVVNTSFHCFPSLNVGTLDVESNGARIYPNPVSTDLFIETQSNNNYSYSLTDLQGELISKKYFKGNCNISMDNLSRGIYFLILDNHRGNLIRRKVIVD